MKETKNMAQQINVSLNEIYKQLCPKCQKKVRDLIKDKLADDVVKRALEE